MSKGKVYFKNKPNGVIEKTPEGTFLYNYQQSNEKAVSWTLPPKESPYTSEELFPFFDGLIPEGWLLSLVHKNWKLPKDDRMSLLLVACQDCIGAAHVLSAEQPDKEALANKKSLKSYDSTSITSDRCLVC